MEDELEEMWTKFSLTEEEGESFSLGSSTTEAAKLVGRNCVVMKVLTHKWLNIEALRKNLRMIWKPTKGVQINEIGDELFLVEFGEGRDKRRIMEMSPWTYEKQLILLKEFVGEQVPKDIVLRQSPFWVQIHNLPLNNRTRESGWEIGSKLGEVLEVDVAESGVQWGRYLRVKVMVDVSKKLVRGKKIAFEGREQRWITFKYERLPNFCYRCGLLNHGLRDCPEGKMEDGLESAPLQYGAWLRGEVPRKGGDEPGKAGHEDRWQTRGSPAKEWESRRVLSQHAPEMSLVNVQSPESTLPHLGGKERGEDQNVGDRESPKQRNDHGKGKETIASELPQGTVSSLVKETEKGSWTQSPKDDRVTWEEKTHLEDEAFFKFRVAANTGGNEDAVGQEGLELKSGPMAMRIDSELGWVAEELGPKSGHWKRLARAAHLASPKKEGPKNKILGKDQARLQLRHWKTLLHHGKGTKFRNRARGATREMIWLAERRRLRSSPAEPHECARLELSGFRVIPDSPTSLR